MKFVLYVDGAYHGEMGLHKVMKEAERFLQFGCNVEIRQDDDLKVTFAYSNHHVSAHIPKGENVC